MSELRKKINAIFDHIEYHSDLSCAYETAKELLTEYKAKEVHQAFGADEETLLMKLCGRTQESDIYESFLDLLVETCPDLDRKDKKGDSALFYAVKAHNLYATQALIQKGASVSLQNEKDETALMISCATSINGEELVDFLIKAGCPLNYQDEKGETALIKAAQTGDLKKMRKLVEGGALLDHQDKKGQTALMKALRYRPRGYEGDEKPAAQMIRVLIQKGADPTITDQEGKTAYDYAKGFYLKSAFSTALLSVLKEANKKKPSFQAEALYKEVLHDVLVREAAPDPLLLAELRRINFGKNDLNSQGNLKNQAGRLTPSSGFKTSALLLDENLEKALQKANGEKIIELFLKGICFAGLTKIGKSALDLAYETNNAAILDTVLKLSDKNQVNGAGDTLLLRAVKEKNKEAVKLLLSHTVDLGVKDKNGKDAFNIAMCSGESEITSLIKEAAMAIYLKKKVASQFKSAQSKEERQKD